MSWLKVFAEAEQSAVPAAVARRVVTRKSFNADEVDADVAEGARSPAFDKALLIAVEPKVSCTRASIAN